MKKTITRRMTLAALSSLALLGAAGAPAQTAYPSQPIKFIVPYPAGGATDVLARMVAQKMQDSWQQTVVVENKPGAGGTIGNNLVAKAPADGHTVLFGIVALVQQMTLMKLPYDPIKDFAPISRVAISPSVLAASPTLPINNLAEFTSLVKANPGKHSIGSYGPGTSAHLQGALLNLQSGLDLTHVPYQGGAPLVTAMMGGQLSSAFMDAGSSKQHLPKFKLLGVTGTERLSWLPNVPTLKEQGLNSYEPMGWFGLFLPGATSKPVVDKFSAETQRILKLPDVREKIEAMGLIPGGETTESFTKIVKSDADVYARIIRDAKITLN
ncbi:tripartite tricarboxylate transporter substrate binding protein [Limnohabitans sp. 2KL-51]|jgi:tripartite-type tricarboxylate transporter receptor subunit TctC|uniref:Bug family tripartite tricarboxylate transporter substrate binding protein n=1 Tax=Limnohabitans sp. 2KL-51 TaxID=1977911 RepID=UPI000D3BBC0E|nr:tripartite tricarboxylate transporter substrate binding protein [Limnohabitans sp. 2KL-51]PUE44836.1 ABC transporter substrate-binding protein [Limnohabitans sp. 2KL-51]